MRLSGFLLALQSTVIVRWVILEGALRNPFFMKLLIYQWKFSVANLATFYVCNSINNQQFERDYIPYARHHNPLLIRNRS